MIIIRVELHSAVTHKITELARMKIYNVGTGSINLRDYCVEVYKGRSKEALDKNTLNKWARINSWPSERFHIWFLVAKALNNLGYMKPE